MNRVSIVIPTYNRVRLLHGLLDNLERLVIPENTDLEIIVVDNNSTDSTRDVVEEIRRKSRRAVRYILEKERGSSHARNGGIREAKGEIIAFLDDDETANADWLCEIMEAFGRFKCQGVAGKLIPKWTESPPEWYTTEGPYRIVGATSGHNRGDKYLEYTVDTLLPGTGNLAVRKECFEKHGLFRTDLGPRGEDYSLGEDKEFCIRLIQAGEKLIYAPNAVVYNTVHEDRVTKQYCKRYHFRYGRANAILFEPKPGTRRYFNVPRHLFRMYGEDLIRWIGAIVTGKSQAIFYYRLSLSRISGEIYEHFLQKR
jgi:glucosyl-dolichyl phosphate glucuronosyltransferase